MELKKLEIIHYRVEMREVFETSFGKTKTRDTVLIHIIDRCGEEGWGEAPVDDGPWYSYETVYTAIHVIRDYIAKLLAKHNEVRDPWEYVEVIRTIRGHNMAKAGVEFALWDLYARLMNKPLYEVLGGIKKKVEAGLSIGVIGDLNKLIKYVDKGLEKGYRRIKLKIKPGWDILPVKKVREINRDIPLQVDANAAYTLKDTYIFKELDKYELLMIEQPLHYDDLYEHSILQKEIKTPICLDESIKNVYDAKAGYALGSYKIINIKPARIGGLIETLKIHDFAEKHDIPLWIGGLLETGIGRAFQVAAATLPMIKYPSDISESIRFYKEEIVEPPWTLNKDGTYTVPSKKGIGIEVLYEKIMKNARKIINIKF